jgi:hypothetical protein
MKKKRAIIFRSSLSEIIQEIDIISNDFTESKNENAIDIIKRIQLNILLMRFETILLDFNMLTVWAPFLQDIDQLEIMNMLGHLDGIRKDLGEYSKQLNSIKNEIRNLYNKAELIRISIIAKLVRGKYASITEIEKKIKGDNELIKKKAN